MSYREPAEREQEPESRSPAWKLKAFLTAQLAAASGVLASWSSETLWPITRLGAALIAVWFIVGTVSLIVSLIGQIVKNTP